MITSEKDLLTHIANCEDLDAIVVEGYDGVGKGRVLNILSDLLSVVPYRPDYTLWQQYEHHQPDRWKISGFFWDVYSHFYKDREKSGPPLLFDRGVLSGAVYNGDMTIADNYPAMLRGMKVLHIIVTCSEEDYKKFAQVRKAETSSYESYQYYTSQYIENCEAAGVDYIIYENHFIEDLAERLANTCEGCGHYNYGYCRHPAYNCKVIGSSERCKFSRDKEVQDKDDAEMHSMRTTRMFLSADTDRRKLFS